MLFLFLLIAALFATGLLAHRAHQPFWIYYHPTLALLLTALALFAGSKQLKKEPDNSRLKGLLILLLAAALMGLGAHMNFFPILFHQAFIVLLFIVGAGLCLNYLSKWRKMRHK